MNWNTKPKIATAAAVLGLLVGAGMGGESGGGDDAQADSDARRLVQKAETEADARVEQATADADQAAADAAQATEQATSAAVDEAVAAEKAKRQKLIDAAVSKAVKKAKASAPEPRTLVDTKPASTDPRFDTCGAANAAGYGNYRQGADPEYDWYQDRDGDGSVCE
jgi:membrane protein involved in colicin uptake